MNITHITGVRKASIAVRDHDDALRSVQLTDWHQR